MLTTTHEIALHASMYASPKGYSWLLIEQLRILPHPKYRYTVHNLDSSDLFLPDLMVEGIITGWHDAYISDAMQRLGACPINHLYTNTLAYKEATRKRFAEIKRKGWNGEKPPSAADWKYHQVCSWHHVENLAGDTLQTALLNLSAAVNGRQLMMPEEYADRLRDEMQEEFDWDLGVKSMPLLLSAFVQAFSLLPLKRELSAAGAYLRKGWA